MFRSLEQLWLWGWSTGRHSTHCREEKGIDLVAQQHLKTQRRRWVTRNETEWRWWRRGSILLSQCDSLDQGGKACRFLFNSLMFNIYYFTSIICMSEVVSSQSLLQCPWPCGGGMRIGLLRGPHVQNYFPGKFRLSWFILPFLPSLPPPFLPPFLLLIQGRHTQECPGWSQ